MQKKKKERERETDFKMHNWNARKKRENKRNIYSNISQ